MTSNKNFSKFEFTSSGAGTIWVTSRDTTNNLKFLHKEIELRINREEPTICVLHNEGGNQLKATPLNDRSRYFTFESTTVSTALEDGQLHLCFIKDTDINDIHNIKVEIVVTFPEEEDKEDFGSSETRSVSEIRNIKLSSDHPKALIFDTETSGLTSGFNVILQLSYQIVDLTNWKVIKEVNHFFDWPEDEWKVEPEAIYVNGLTQEFLDDQVTSDKFDALWDFYNDLEDCDVAIAHNLSFDKGFIIEDSLEELVLTDPDEKDWPLCIDTMIDTTEYCKLLPLKNGEYKWPKLSELASKLSVNCYDLKLHDSRSDVELTKRCFKKLCELGFYKLDGINQTVVKSNFNSIKKGTFISAISEEVEKIGFNISSDKLCLSTFTLPKVTSPSNLVFLDYGIDPRFEQCKDVLNYISPAAYSFVKNQKGSYEAKYTFQNMKDRIDAEIASLSTFSVSNNSIQTPDEVIDLCGSTLAVLQKIVSSFEIIINDRFITYYGQPGEPSDFKGLYAVSDFYARLTAMVYKMYLGFDQLVAPDQLAKKMFDGYASICYNLYYQAKSYPKESLDKILDIESNPRVRGTIDLACHLTIDMALSDEMVKTIKNYEYVYLIK